MGSTLMDVAGLERSLERRIHGRVRTAVPLAPMTTYRLGGPARVLVEPESTEDLRAVAAELRGLDEPLPVLPLGRGSNLVISDHGFPGIVIRMGPSFSWIRPGEGEGALTGGASTSMPQLANWATRRGLAGLEFTVAIPGSLGGGVRMNAGAHGGQISDHLTSVAVFDLETATVEDRPAPSLDLSYRRSNLTEKQIVLEASFDLALDEEARIKERMDSYRRHRAETQPGALQNAGSVFKNPEGDSAGRLVEAAGLKGFTVGKASVSELHANFFIAADGAAAQDVFDLVREVRARVAERFSIDLEPEVRFVGDFDGKDAPTFTTIGGMPT